jgi:hypothetical protein
MNLPSVNRIGGKIGLCIAHRVYSHHQFSQKSTVWATTIYFGRLLENAP